MLILDTQKNDKEAQKKRLEVYARLMKEKQEKKKCEGK